ncbi:two-component system regulatory protein YycI [Anaerotignum sp.]|uniref:two-component system regulatory protein YycI n=1 Tax=Anaerotignum sp. TaxID=2039241 RepID=UPI0027155799|nr:two-component system regulatory protein YycI [Anaerotignum sp.]
MEWAGAKRFVIVLLLILNIILAGLNIQQKRDNTMTSAQEKAIFEVLSQNGITLYTDLNIDTKPMYRLEAKVPSYSKEDLEAAIFDGEKTKVSVGTKTVYKTENEILTLEGDKGTFVDKTVEKGLINLNKEAAIKLAEHKMQQMEPIFGEYELCYSFKEEDGWRIDFCSIYKDEVVFSNHFSFFVSDQGIYQLDFTYCEITGMTQEKKEICMEDEALMTFMQEWNKRDSAEDAAIQKLEIGYDLMEQGQAVMGTGLFLEPCYRIYLMEESEPYLVNAYTCQIVKKDVK